MPGHVRFNEVIMTLTYAQVCSRMLTHAGHVRFNEVIMTLMYWNKERNIVPSKAQVLVHAALRY